MPSRKPLSNRNILVTCGPTWVAVDDVRVLSNRSSGQLGIRLAEQLTARGARVTLLLGPVTWPRPDGIHRIVSFRFYDELKLQLKKLLRRRFDAVIHAAAVADFQVANARQGKIGSDRRNLNLRLTPTEKLITMVKKLRPDTILVGFKLEPAASLTRLRAEGLRLMENARCDIVVANRFRGQAYEGVVLTRNGRNRRATAKSRGQAIRQLITALEKNLDKNRL